MKPSQPDDNRVVPPSRSTAEKHFEAVVAELRGRRLADVVYYPLTSGDDGLLTEEWDFGDWHEPTMGVELITDLGHRYSAIWNNTFTYYGLEIFPKPMTDILATPGSWIAVPVSEHPRWAGLIGKKIIAADICWDHDLISAVVREPSAFRLGFRGNAVWIAAGVSVDAGSATSFCLGTDDVMVVFTPEMASRTGIPESR